MKISIALASYNGESHIAQQLDSLLSQSLTPHEIIISDDNSRDSTPAILKRYAEAPDHPTCKKSVPGHQQ